jgi:hypothetical protein
MTVHETDAARLAALLEQQRWRYARTLYWIPHWYSLAKTWSDPTAFAWAVQTIWALGVPRTFGKKEYRYFDAGEWMYWTMTPAEDVLINRARLAPRCPHCGREISFTEGGVTPR